MCGILLQIFNISEYDGTSDFTCFVVNVLFHKVQDTISDSELEDLVAHSNTGWRVTGEGG